MAGRFLPSAGDYGRSMARLEDRHDGGADGDWFVDDRCIDCDAARQVAPGLIIRNAADGNSLFVRQPQTDEEIEMAWRAAMVCPTRSVGHATLKRPPSPVFPHDLGDSVFRLRTNIELMSDRTSPHVE